MNGFFLVGLIALSVFIILYLMNPAYLITNIFISLLVSIVSVVGFGIYLASKLAKEKPPP